MAEVSLCEIALRWMLLDLTNDKAISVKVMVWCHQATSHYLSQCWPSSMTSYDVTRPQWVNWSQLIQTILHTKSFCNWTVTKTLNVWNWLDALRISTCSIPIQTTPVHSLTHGWIRKASLKIKSAIAGLLIFVQNSDISYKLSQFYGCSVLIKSLIYFSSNNFSMYIGA